MWNYKPVALMLNILCQKNKFLSVMIIIVSVTIMKVIIFIGAGSVLHRFLSSQLKIWGACISSSVSYLYIVPTAVGKDVIRHIHLRHFLSILFNLLLELCQLLMIFTQLHTFLPGLFSRTSCFGMIYYCPPLCPSLECCNRILFSDPFHYFFAF